MRTRSSHAPISCRWRANCVSGAYNAGMAYQITTDYAEQVLKGWLSVPHGWSAIVREVGIITRAPCERWGI